VGVHVDGNRIVDNGPFGVYSLWAWPGPGSSDVTFRDNTVTPPGTLTYSMDDGLIDDAGTTP